MNFKLKREKRYRRHKRERAKIKGTRTVPRLSLFRSNRNIWCQLIDDEKGITLAQANNKELVGGVDNKPKVTKKHKLTIENGRSKVAVAYEVGKLIARKAKEKGIKEIVFDRGGYKYHGRVKSLAEGARKEGLKF